jgi:hypothetical protein
LTGCAVEFAADAPTVDFPRIHIDRLSSEFVATGRPWAPQSVVDWLAAAVEGVRTEPEPAGVKT